MMSDHDPLCEFGEHSPIDSHLEPRHCRCELIAQVREDDRQEIRIDIEQQLRINYSLAVPSSLPQSEFLRGQEAAYRHMLEMLKEDNNDAAH